MRKYLALFLCILTLVSMLPVALIVRPVKAQLSPLYGGTLINAVPVMPNTFNGAIAYDGYLLYEEWNVFDQLTHLVNGTVLVPDLAYDWTASPDFKQWTFQLYHNVTWHDGVNFTSADVKYTIEGINAIQGYRYDIFQNVLKIDTPDPYTVTLYLNQSNSHLAYDLGDWYMAPILPKHIFEGTDWKTNPATMKPIGTGPFKFSEWVSGDHITLVANDNYFRGRPYLDRIIFRYIPDYTTAFTALETGEIGALPSDYIEPLSIPQFLGNPAISVSIRPDIGPIVINFNLKKPPFDNVLVRRAFLYGIDRVEVSKRAYANWCPPSENMFLRGSDLTNPAVVLPAYNQTMAEKLLDQAGYPRKADGTRFSTTLTSSSYGGEPDAAQVIIEQLARIGVKVTYVGPLDFSTYISKVLGKRDFDFSVSDGNRGSPAQEQILLGTTGYRNEPQYSNPEVDKLFSEIRSTADPAQIRQYFYKIQEILYTDLPMFLLVDYMDAFMNRADFHGLPWQYELSGGRDFIYSKVWWTGGTPLSTMTTTAATATTTAVPTGVPAEYFYTVTIALIVVIIAAIYIVARNRARTRRSS
jgi:peptide/nickel transport system substrate-binding protein